MAKKSLNPYSNGIALEQIYFLQSISNNCLNPYSNGIALELILNF